MSRMKNVFKRLTGNIHGLLFVLWIYLSVGWRHYNWRRRLRSPRSVIEESTQTSMKQTLLFIRHGQTTWNVEHRLPGQLPGIHLTDTGKHQAERLADALTVLPISAVISSPLERASETAEIIARPRQLAIQFEADLMDIDVGHWAGQDHDELNKSNEEWKAFKRNPAVAPPDVETFPQVQARAIAAIERWRKREESGAYPAFVVHADVIKLLIAHYTGLEATQAGKLMIDNASVSIVEVEDDKEALVVAISWSPKPGWLKPPTSESKSLPTEDAQTGDEKISQEH
jgi:broad specificity phosphatase PhoE